MISLDTIEIHKIPPFNYGKKVENSGCNWLGTVAFSILLIMIAAYIYRTAMVDEDNEAST